MKALGLDLSTHAGWAVLDSENGLSLFGVYHAPKDPYQKEYKVQDYKFLDRAELVAKTCLELAKTHNPDAIFIEQTNGSKNREDQKLLEFIHAKVLEYLRPEFEDRISYIDTSAWRSTLSIRLSKDQKKHNKKVREFNKALDVAREQGDNQKIQDLKRDKKLYLADKPKGKITPKHLAVAWANETYSIKLLQKDNDIADAIALAKCGIELSKKTFTPPDLSVALK